MNKRATRQAMTAFAALGICLFFEVSVTHAVPVELLTKVTAARILEDQLGGKRGEENALASEKLPHLALSKKPITSINKHRTPHRR